MSAATPGNVLRLLSDHISSTQYTDVRVEGANWQSLSLQMQRPLSGVNFGSGSGRCELAKAFMTALDKIKNLSRDARYQSRAQQDQLMEDTWGVLRLLKQKGALPNLDVEPFENAYNSCISNCHGTAPYDSAAITAADRSPIEGCCAGLCSDAQGRSRTLSAIIAAHPGDPPSGFSAAERAFLLGTDVTRSQNTFLVDLSVAPAEEGGCDIMRAGELRLDRYPFWGRLLEKRLECFQQYNSACRPFYTNSWGGGGGTSVEESDHHTGGGISATERGCSGPNPMPDYPPGSCRCEGGRWLCYPP